MNQHTYLRAYLAGIAVPTPLLLVAMTVYIVFRLVYHFPVPVERIIVFPMAVIPNAWGLWNILFMAWRGRLQMSIGLHGALLPFLLAPFGMAVRGILDIPIPNVVVHALPIIAPAGLIAYYLAWKYLVGSLNRILGLA